MGSDWSWELRFPPGPAVRRVYELAARRNLHPERPDGLINLFTDAGHRTVQDRETALAAMATGETHGQLWANGDDDIDVFVSVQPEHLVWTLDAVFCHREPGSRGPQ